MAPEVLKGDINLANPLMDVWALGIMMYMMLFGQHPYQTYAKGEQVKNIISRITNSEELNIDQQEYDFILDEIKSEGSPTKCEEIF